MGPLNEQARVKRAAREGQASPSSQRRIVEVHLGCIAAGPLVAADRPGQPPALVGGRFEEGAAEIAVSASEGDPAETLAVVTGSDAADMAVANDADLEQPRRSGGDPRAGPAGAIGACRIQRVA